MLVRQAAVREVAVERRRQARKQDLKRQLRPRRRACEAVEPYSPRVLQRGQHALDAEEVEAHESAARHDDVKL